MAFLQNKLFSFLLLSTALQNGRAVLNFHDEDFFGHTADLYDWSKHPCRRDCINENSTQTCHYVLVVEIFYAMSVACYDCPLNITDCFRPHCIPADGREKPVYVVNRQLPGPLIEVCEQDEIVVDVRNLMLSESTTIHWHGFKQKGTPYMDGVPYVSQCPILPGENFRYTFKATVPGTFFYHSHIGNQRSDGLFGPLIVKKYMHHEKMNGLYDKDDHHMIVSDWTSSSGDEVFTKFYYKGLTVPDNILINGLGPYRKFKKGVYTPLATFHVTSGLRYRFRMIDAGSEDCPIKMSIDHHSLLVIGMDSNDIEPVEVDAITIWPGERVDFILRANQKADNYWINFSGYGLCNNDSNSGVHQAAILRYEGVESKDPKGSVGYSLPFADNQRVLNPYNIGTEVKSSRNIDIAELKALEQNDVSLGDEVHQQVYIGFNFWHIDNYDFDRHGIYGYDQINGMATPQLNHISLKLPSVPLMSQWEMLAGSDPFCNVTHLPNHKNCTDKAEQCACTHVIQLPLKKVIELIFVAEGPAGEAISLHPLHLHGHFFRVVAMKKLKGNVTIEQVKRLDREGKIRRNLDRAPLKDTIKTPDGGYTIVRLHTNNPGYWFFHCHFEQHHNVGMALIFKIGEHQDFPEKPTKFPTCGNYDS